MIEVISQQDWTCLMQVLGKPAVTQQCECFINFLLLHELLFFKTFWLCSNTGSSITFMQHDELKSELNDVGLCNRKLKISTALTKANQLINRHLIKRKSIGREVKKTQGPENQAGRQLEG